MISEILTRCDAKALLSTRYFTGNPCTHGHISERLTSNGTCTECLSIGKKKHYIKNKDHFSDYARQWRLKNIEHVTERNQTYYIKNKESRRALQKDYARINSAVAVKRAALWSKGNPDAVRAKNSKRRAKMSQRTVSWYGEFDEFVWREAASLSRLRTSTTGIQWHVDHIVPLHCKSASGLHTGHNCQVIPARLNILKSNSLTLITFSDWLFQS